MTSHYLDIHLRPDPELAPHHLMDSLYGRLHRALAQRPQQDIGASFPGHDSRKPSPGTHLRLHGPEAALQELVASPWLHGLRDHLRVGAIEPVPPTTKHRRVSRAQAKSNVERLRRRAMKRHDLTAEQAAARLPASVEKRLPLPYVTLASRSTGQPSFPLFIQHGPVLETPVAGTFNTYGLSQHATVPWF